MIPKIIHYCWFGRNPLPEAYLHYIESWKRFCPDYEIREWNEDNFDVHQNQYCSEAYQAGKWAFVSDYARLKIIYDNGGVYLDTDIEMVKPIDDLLVGEGFFGFQSSGQINTGLGFAANKDSQILAYMLKIYDFRSFKIGTKYDMTPCPVINSIALKKFGVKMDKKSSKNIQYISLNTGKPSDKLGGVMILPEEYLNPLNVNTRKVVLTGNTYCIHHYAGTWISDNDKRSRIKQHIPAAILSLRTDIISSRSIANFERKYADQLANI